MIFLKILFSLILFKFYFAHCMPITNKNVHSEFEERISKLQLENSELVLENVKLKLEIIELRLENESATATSDRISKFSVQTLWEDVQSLKKYFDKTLAYFSKRDLNAKYSSEEIEIKEKALPKNCFEAANGNNGVYTIELPTSGLEPFQVVCDARTQNGGWTLIQQRFDGSTNFYRNWSEYKAGFGTISVIGEFFIGLEKLHKMTAAEPYELLVVLEDFNNVTKYANYDSFAIGSEAEQYILKELGSYSGTAGDSLVNQKGQKFSTFDRDNDVHKVNCAETYKGAWWYKDCHLSNLNGLYIPNVMTEKPEGMIWYLFHNRHHYPLKLSKMMIRPKVALPAMCKKFMIN